MNSFTIKTALPFPIIELEENVMSTEVKKPSGVAYMLLVLLKESKNKMDNLSKLLETFGVPRRLHDIFDEEIKSLVRQGILEVSEYRNFENYILKDIKFTQLGETVFKEECITTGNQKQNEIKAYYDVAADTLSLKPENEVGAKQLKNSAIDDDFCNQFNCSLDIKDFFNSKKGPSFKVKAAEIITDVELKKRTNLAGKYNCSLEADGDKLNIKFEYVFAEEFYNNFYTNDILNNALNERFNLDTCYNAKLSEIDESLFYKVITPDDYKRLLNDRHKLVIYRNDNYKNKANNLAVKSIETLDTFSRMLDFINVDDSQILGYAPLKLELDSNKGKIYLPTVVAIKIPIDKFNEAFNPYLESNEKYDLEWFKKVLTLCEKTKNYEEVIKILASYMGEYDDDNITILNEVKPLIKNSIVLTEGYKSLLNTTFDSYIQKVREDNLETTIKLTKNDYSYLGYSKNSYIKKIMESLNNIKSRSNIFDIFLNSGFSINDLLPYINPFEEVLSRKHEPKSDALREILVFDNALNEIIKLTGIKDSLRYSIDIEELRKPEFKALYQTLNNGYNKLNPFKSYNVEYFNRIAGLISVYKEINDFINMEEAALKNVKNLNQKLIEKKIASGDYLFVLINLAAKLSTTLENEYNLEGDLIDQLAKARKNKIITKELESDLHELRKNRNSLSHGGNDEISYTTDDLVRWSNEVFGIGVKKK